MVWKYSPMWPSAMSVAASVMKTVMEALWLLGEQSEPHTGVFNRDFA